MFEQLEKVVSGADAPVDLSELLIGLDTQALAALIAAHEDALTRLADFRLVLAAAWADHHPGVEGRVMWGERPVRVGGTGTPTVSEAGVDEFGDLSKISNGSSRYFLGDVLDLRHRMPRLWFRVCTGGVLEWQARKIVQATRPLSLVAAGRVDRRLEPWVGQLSWGRLVTLLDVEVLSADPDRAAALAAQAEEAMGVWSGSTNERGVKSVYARTDPVSAAWFMGMVNRVADLLAVDGDSRSADRRRAAAVGVLARPADALALLSRHATGTRSEPVEDPSTSSGNVCGAGPSTSSGNVKTSSGNVCGAGPSTSSGNVTTSSGNVCGAGPSTSSGLVDEQGRMLPEPVEGPVMDVDELREPDPELDEVYVSEYRPCGHPDERPVVPPPEEPDEPCSCDPDPLVRTGVEFSAGVDVRAARPKAVLHFHLSDEGLRTCGGRAWVRPGQGEPAMLNELLDWLAGTGCQISIQPVIDPASTASADAYEIPDRIRNAVRYRDIADVSPWGTSTSPSLDLDHTRAYRTLGPPGQTRVDNLAPLVRPTHLVKTAGIKKVRQPEPGVFVWRSRQGYITVVTNRGTISLGRNTFSEQVWELAKQPRSAAESRLIDICRVSARVEIAAA